jgi:hypothetical protein
MNFLAWLEQTAPSVWIRDAPTLWAFPFVLFLHTLGLGIVAGLSVAINVAMLKFGGRHALAPIERFFPVVWLGFTVSLVSGLLLLLAYPTKALTDPVFYLKIGLIVGALAQLQWLHRRIRAQGDAAPPIQVDRKVRVATLGAVALWLGAVLTGRLLAYTYHYLTAADALQGSFP